MLALLVCIMRSTAKPQPSSQWRLSWLRGSQGYTALLCTSWKDLQTQSLSLMTSCPSRDWEITASPSKQMRAFALHIGFHQQHELGQHFSLKHQSKAVIYYFKPHFLSRSWDSIKGNVSLFSSWQLTFFLWPPGPWLFLRTNCHAVASHDTSIVMFLLYTW